MSSDVRVTACGASVVVFGVPTLGDAVWLLRIDGFRGARDGGESDAHRETPSGFLSKGSQWQMKKGLGVKDENRVPVSDTCGPRNEPIGALDEHPGT